MARLSSVRTDCVVLDLMLPDGDGTIILKHLRKTSPSTRVAVTTGVNDTAWLDHVRAANPDCLLLKPIKLADLLACLG
jgi:DNA-binding NarL/FixJ family response regulator